jgi:hypothetical protein
MRPVSDMAGFAHEFNASNGTRSDNADLGAL